MTRRRRDGRRSPSNRGYDLLGPTRREEPTRGDEPPAPTADNTSRIIHRQAIMAFQAAEGFLVTGKLSVPQLLANAARQTTSKPARPPTPRATWRDGRATVGCGNLQRA